MICFRRNNKKRCIESECKRGKWNAIKKLNGEDDANN